MYAKVAFVGYKGNAENHTVAVDVNSTGVLVRVDKHVLGDSFEQITVTVYNADGSVYAQGADSVESYISRASASGTATLYSCIAKFAYAGREYLLNK